MKTYTKNNVNFSFSPDRCGGKWIFTAGNFQLIRPDVRGKERAEKIAAQIAGAIKRGKAELDNLAKFQIEKIIG